MSEALNYFLDEKTVCADLDFTDAAIDYAFMLSQNDWAVLLSKWTNNSDEWKSAITYYTGFAYLTDGVQILQKALRSNKKELQLQALFSIYKSVNAELENAEQEKNKKSLKSILNIFSNEDIQKIEEELKSNSSNYNLYPELHDLQKIIIEYKKS